MPVKNPEDFKALEPFPRIVEDGPDGRPRVGTPMPGGQHEG